MNEGTKSVNVGDYYNNGFKDGRQQAIKEELEFLKEWNADDLIKQAIEERSHYYVKSRALMIKERIKQLEKEKKQDDNK